MQSRVTEAILLLVARHGGDIIIITAFTDYAADGGAQAEFEIPSLYGDTLGDVGVGIKARIKQALELHHHREKSKHEI